MLFGGKSKTKIGLVVDCGTSAVRAALYSSEGTGPRVKPRVSQIIRVPFDAVADITADILRQRTLEALHQILAEIPPHTRLSDMCIGLSSPFYISQTRRITRDRSFAQSSITRQEIATLTMEATSGFMQELAQSIPESNIMVFSKLPLKTFINGYRVENPLAKDGKTIEMHLRFEATTNAVYQDLTWRATSMFPGASLRLVSIPTAYFYALSAVYDTEQGFLLVDVGGEVSDISLISNGVLERVVTIPLGNNLFLREVAELLHIPLPDAAFMVRRYAEQTLEENRLRQILPLVASFQKIWHARFANVLEHYAKDQEIPSRILFVGGGVLPFYQESFTENFLQSLALRKKITMSVLSPSLLEKSFAAHQFASSSDMALMCLTLLTARGVL